MLYKNYMLFINKFYVKYKIFKRYYYEKVLFRSKCIIIIKYSDPLIQIDRYIEIKGKYEK